MTTPLLNRYILCQYKAIQNSSKTDKIPLHPLTLRSHDPFDSSIHMYYEEAKRTAELYGQGYGIGFVILKEDKYFCIDIDNCLKIEGGWNEIAIKIMTLFTGCYMEVSNSQRGLHIFGKYEGDRPIHACKKSDQGLELYTDRRFIALAEINSQGSFDTIHTSALHSFIADYFPEILNSRIENSDWTTESCEGCNPPESDEEFIKILLKRGRTQHEVFRQIASFKDLFEANQEVLCVSCPPNPNSNYPYDPSSADYQLAKRLMYFTGHNCERIERIMNQSQLVINRYANNDTKWNREEYRRGSILKAKNEYLSQPRENREDSFFTWNTPNDGHHNLPEHNTASGSNIQHPLNIKLFEKENYPETNNSKVLDTSTNLKCLIDIFGISIRWNIMTRKRDVLIPGVTLFSDDKENDALRLIKDVALLNNLPILRIDENLDSIAQKNSYHPIVEGLKENIWDGVPRLHDFINTIESSTPELSYKLIKRWMISAIAAAHSKEGFKSSGVLVLSGEQNIGKTIWIRNLDPFNCKAVKEGAVLDPTNKDCLISLSSVWIAELGELDATFRKSDMARLKSYLTNDSDTVRAPYARKDSILARRTVFAASVNNSNFLMDETGNRRWWTIPVLSINQNHGLDMAQVWAEVYTIWEGGEQTYLTKEEFEELNIHNVAHEQLNPLEEALYLIYDFSEEGKKDKARVMQSATEVLWALGYDKPGKALTTQMGKLLTKATGLKPKKEGTMNKHSLLLKSKSTS